ncbi:DUF7694 domain-containing protein [Agrobacterium tumefaciens]|uniref:DUF7694 domain-containing protein n=1 Tax=Agrobacterium tumefaciens TaxID=358 RepID=UPI0009D70ED2
MSYSTFDDMPRRNRRLILRDEAIARRAGKWSKWETLKLPRGTVHPHGWTAEITTAHRNNVFSVLDRTLPDGTRHLAITSLSGVRPTWPEMQRIKDEIVGPEATAVEVYPPRAEIVDDADMYHLWVLPAPLPFSLFPRTSHDV